MQIDLVDPAAQARRKGLGGCFARINGARSHAEVGLLLIESPRQDGGRSQDAGGKHHDESRQKGASDLGAKALNERSVLMPSSLRR